ncbi:DUF445 domain-containing protein [Falsarthrobacter nasiphocae]|uniref:DUF445 domain-containing protein n=1 Tax=Falsarthrobacter nasiphocae TaxID=189863 RepID=UPI003CD0AA7F
MSFTSSTSDEARRAGLRRMQRVALALLIVSAVVFCVSFALQGAHPWLAYVRAASEGALVGGLADWFAVTALFRHPMGIPVPHTAIIEKKKDTIGESLSEFIAENFLSPDLVREKIARWGFAPRLGRWLAEPEHASDVVARLAPGVRAGLATLDDDDVQRLIAALARDHIVEPAWAPTVGLLLEDVVAAGHHTALVDVVVTRAEEYVREHPGVVDRLVGERAPAWVPGIVNVLVADRVHAELVGFLGAVRQDPDHSVRRSLNEYLIKLGRDLQGDPKVIAAFEGFKKGAIDDPLVRQLAGRGWATIKDFLISSAEDPRSDLRVAAVGAVETLGRRLAEDRDLARTVETTAANAAASLVGAYGHEIASIVSETVAAWDAREASEKIELQVGRDLQFIRINGTVVGALAGLVIFAVAHAAFGA